MSNTTTNTATLTSSKIVDITEVVEIADEEWIGEQTATHIDVEGELTIIQDESLPEDQQVYVHLSAQKVRALVAFLNQSDVASTYTSR